MRDSGLPDWPARMQTAREASSCVPRPSAPPPISLGEHVLEMQFVDCQYEVGRASVHLQRLHVWPKTARREGRGGRAVEAVKAIAKKLGRPVTLTFSADKGCDDQLRRFYKRHGFHFLSDSETMIWRP